MATAASSDADNRKKQRWFPLESNPDLLNSYITKLGFNASLYKFYDVFSTESWALEMVPQHAVALLMLYPLTDVQLAFQEKNDQSDEKKVDTKGVWHMKQRIGNACGTVGILHALANIPQELQQIAITPDSWLGRFYSSSSHNLTSVEKAEILEGDSEIGTMHDSATESEANQTKRGSLDDRINTHFIALVNVDDKLYEMDGRKDGPIGHGNTSKETFLADACKVVKMFMDRDPGELRFTIMALAPTQE